MRDGWAATAPDDELDLAPLCDGGPGFVAGAARRAGRRAAARHGQRTARRARARRPSWSTADAATAYVEAAEACGLHLLAAGDRDPGRTTTYGVGELVEAAAGRRRAPDRRRASAARPRTTGEPACWPRSARVRPSCSAAGGARAGRPAATTRCSELADGSPAAARASSSSLAAATDLPLLGFHGASATYAERQGCDARAGPGARGGARATTPTWPRARSSPGRPLAGQGPGGGRGRRCRRRPRLRPAAARRALRRRRRRGGRGDRAGRPDRPKRPGGHRRGDLRLAARCAPGSSPAWPRSAWPRACPASCSPAEVLVGPARVDDPGPVREPTPWPSGRPT